MAVEPSQLLIFFAATFAIGGLAALMGVGGGILIVPLLDFMGVPLKEAVGAGFICALATSAAGSIALDKARLSDLGLVCQMELATAVGVLIGAELLASILPERAVAAAFAALLLYAAWRFIRKRAKGPDEAAAPPDTTHRAAGWTGFAAVGVLSGVTGVGGGPFKVPIQTEVLGVPLRVALANSNLMVGMTGAVGAAAYYGNGWLHAAVSAPCALGAAFGAFLGGKLATRIRASRLRTAFIGLLLLVAGKMAWKALALGS